MEPEIDAFEILPADQLVVGDRMVDLGVELTGVVVATTAEDLSEPGDHALIVLWADLWWREEGPIVESTEIRCHAEELRVIARRF